MTDKVLVRIVALNSARMSELKSIWRSLFNTDAPPYNRHHLESRLAYKIQELAHGGICAETTKRLEKVAKQFAEPATRKRKTGLDADGLVAGTKLLREWHGSSFETVVQVDGYAFNGRLYRSLTGVAKAITGTQWNGRAFFGLQRPLIMMA